eukprot:CAMPEP_0171459340 /NCGR_PEP_ID=MMETSP0945-20130129/4661_1 /TAXON_ID=109269 /ORGANISM="Vaucheria litorea, Strain CCMP2940" /LENGTH=283 /DNA_ID=CAMNT_0011985335 /DNA_START=328 /DNA_END=1180 /DNA_ORIENTATION=+
MQHRSRERGDSGRGPLPRPRYLEFRHDSLRQSESLSKNIQCEHRLFRTGLDRTREVETQLLASLRGTPHRRRLALRHQQFRTELPLRELCPGPFLAGRNPDTALELRGRVGPDRHEEEQCALRLIHRDVRAVVPGADYSSDLSAGGADEIVIPAWYSVKSRDDFAVCVVPSTVSANVISFFCFYIFLTQLSVDLYFESSREQQKNVDLEDGVESPESNQNVSSYGALVGGPLTPNSYEEESSSDDEIYGIAQMYRKANEESARAMRVLSSEDKQPSKKEKVDS